MKNSPDRSEAGGNSLMLDYNNKIVFFDYSDDTVYAANPEKFDIYFKRSLSLKENHAKNVVPLGLHLNIAGNSFSVLSKFSKDILLDKRSKVEVVRGVDLFNVLTNNSHNARSFQTMDRLKLIPTQFPVIFLTRLWDPARNDDPEEKRRREKQNLFRTEACRIIKNNFKNAVVGIYPDYFAKKYAPDLIVPEKVQTTLNYFKLLGQSKIGIADDGLKDTPGWKIGEYAYFNKPIISTPINVIVPQFEENINYMPLAHRTDFQSIPHIVDNLLTNTSMYDEMYQNNKRYADTQLDPLKYFEKIIGIIDSF
ncbi:MAG TPA: hypothetical protein VGB50_04085 [Flavobacterium sp.]